MNLRERAKYVTYRTPMFNRLMAPGYPYKVNPAELAAMVNFIDATRDVGGAIVEVGVAQGDTSVFLLEHVRTVADDSRRVVLLDTFGGFTEESVRVEVSERGKDPREFDKFRYGDRVRFERNLLMAGYSEFDVIQADAGRFDWGSLGPIAAVLLDIDLYAPTYRVLEEVYPRLVSGGGIVVDDCLADTPWDGSLQAYEEFISNYELPFERVGRKGAIVRKAE